MACGSMLQGWSGEENHSRYSERERAGLVWMLFEKVVRKNWQREERTGPGCVLGFVAICGAETSSSLLKYHWQTAANSTKLESIASPVLTTAVWSQRIRDADK
jgi:hypothetical protein